MKLFKLLSVGALMLGTVAVSNAQEDASNADSMAVSFGVKGGVNFATLNGDIESPDSRTSFHVGVLAEFPIAEIFSIQAEALYSGQGAEFDFEGSDGDKAELQLDYINVPVLAKFYLFEGFSIEAGPQFSFLLNDEIDFNPNSNSGDSPTPFRDSLKTFEVGVAGGVTFQTAMGLFATARYNQGITDIADDINVQNSVFQLGVGYKF
ncbi:porin family protein [Flavobacterium subsaxonicum]|uniref:Outer membrane protein beta-barrel domain-containing protein n=1 Tax=Flavobacterium subsaxonicum WB 4.1-42 = DSM 21790 TaxID=1121898 RepID=A0A0A2MKP5_9FLAO|nr:porin family protein [Flavobacterium subsaxonicum]KGO92879.1 hypothetical protein Q766_09585 [Flavobacterium subsaxonicum WB 4.1-42 = DSM 21790]